MNIRNMVMEDFRERVKLNPNISGELKAALKTNERVPQFVDNLTAEINKIFNSRRNYKLDRAKLKNLVYDLTDTFCLGVMNEHDNKKRQAEADSLASQVAQLDDKGNGTVEIGDTEIIISDGEASD